MQMETLRIMCQWILIHGWIRLEILKFTFQKEISLKTCRWLNGQTHHDDRDVYDVYDAFHDGGDGVPSCTSGFKGKERKTDRTSGQLDHMVNELEHEKEFMNTDRFERVI